MTHTTTPVPVRQSGKLNIKPALGYLGWAIIFTAIVGATGFYLGAQYANNQQASTKAAVQDALKAVQPAPAAVAEASKN